MALTITQLGSEIATEKLVISALSDDPLVTSVTMEVYVNDATLQVELEHLPILGSTDTFDFEINSIIKDYFASEFLPLTGVNQTTIENALVGFAFQEVINGAIQPTGYFDFVAIKNITQDTFEIEDFDLSDYDCGDAGSSVSKFLTSSPSPLPIGDNTSVHVSCLTTSYTGTTPKQEWEIQTLLNGVLVATLTEDVNVAQRDIPPFAPLDHYDISTYRFDFDSSTGIDEVRILIRDIASPFTTRSETKVFKLNDACERAITLSWLNEFGAQDTFTFLGNITRTGAYTDSTFKRTRPVNPLSTNVGDLVYKSSYNYEYDIFSDRMPENSVQWLSKILINKRAAIQSEAVTASGALSLTNDQYFGSMPIAAAYEELVDAGNGFAYGAPKRSGNFIKYEIATDTITTIATAIPLGLNIQYTYGVLSPTTGKIYYMNSHPDTTDILVFDPVGETHYTFGILTDTVGRPSITPTGIIYANIGFGSSKFFKIDTNTDIITELVSGVTSGGGASVYSPTGFVYVFPNGGSGEYYKINVSTDSISTIVDANYDEIDFYSAVITSLGIIYLPMNDNAPIANEVFVLDTSVDSSLVLNTGSTISGGYNYSFIMSDDNVYLIGDETDILKIDTSTNLITIAGSYTPEDFFKMTVIGNSAYSISRDLNGSVLKLTFESDVAAKPSKYFPITITTEDTVLADKFTPETLFRLKFRLANRRKGLK